MDLVKERLNTLGELKEAIKYFFEEPQYDVSLLPWKQMTQDETRGVLKQIKDVLKKASPDKFSKDNLMTVLEELYQGDKGRVLWPWRVALSGRQASPPPFEIAAILGKDAVIERLDKAIKNLS